MLQICNITKCSNLEWKEKHNRHQLMRLVNVKTFGCYFPGVYLLLG